MKKAIWIFIIAIIANIFLRTYGESWQKQNILVPTISPTSTTSPLESSLLTGEGKGDVKNQTLILDNKTTQAVWTMVSTSSALQLYPNFKEKLSAVEVKKNKSCSQLVNAGFYDKNNNPLGLFVSNGISVKDDRPNEFFNGYFYLNSNNNFAISDTTPDFTPKLALQSGPILLLNGLPRNLKIIDDKPARRIIVGLTKDDKLIFLALFNKDNNLDGPLLENTPSLLSAFSQKTGLNLNSALNLDGGSASTFYSEDISLSELSLVGGFFCIK